GEHRLLAEEQDRKHRKRSGSRPKDFEARGTRQRDRRKPQPPDRVLQLLPTLRRANWGERASSNRAYRACSSGENEGRPVIRNRDSKFAASGRGTPRSCTLSCKPRRKAWPS